MMSASERAAPRTIRMLTGAGSGAVVRVLSSAVTLVSLPLAVRYLGAERYGVWATIASTVVWVNLLDLGIANSLTNHISSAYALGDERRAASSFTNALLMTAGTSLLVSGACVAVWRLINWSALFNVSRAVPPAEVARTVAIALALMLVSLSANLGSKLLAGYQELWVNNLGVALGSLVGLAGLSAGIGLHVSMPLLFFMSIGSSTFVSLSGLLMVTTWYKPWLLPRPSLMDGAVAKDLLGSGGSFFLIQLAAVVVFSSDNLVVSHYCGAAEVTPYSVTWRFVGLAAILQSMIFPALWPAYAEAYARQDFSWIRSMFSRVMKGTLAFNAAVVVLVVLFGRTAIRGWAGAAAVPSLSLLCAMGVWALINGFMSAESCLLAALNRTREQAVLSVIAAAVNLALSIGLVRHIGSLGVILGTILSYLLVLVVPQSLIVRKVIRGTLSEAPAPEEDLHQVPARTTAW